MKRTFIIITLLYFNIVTAQIKSKDYDIYLLFDSSKNEMILGELKTNDSLIFKTFRIHKNVPKENIKHNLHVNDKGELIKVIPSYQNDCCAVTFKHLSTKDSTKVVSKTSNLNLNSIDYATFENSGFENFLLIVRKAKKIYIIDLHEQDSSIFYKAYKVNM